MAVHPNAAPVLFDRALLARRQRRALREGAATFLLDRVVEDASERLAAVNRNFGDVVDVWSPGDGLQAAFGGRFNSFTHLVPPAGANEELPLAPQSLDLALSALAL